MARRSVSEGGQGNSDEVGEVSNSVKFKVVKTLSQVEGTQISGRKPLKNLPKKATMVSTMKKSLTRKKVKVSQYNAVFQQEKDGGFSVWVPALPGCCSEGDTFEETVENIKEAIELYLESSPEILEYGDDSGEKQFLIPIKVSYA